MAKEFPIIYDNLTRMAVFGKKVLREFLYEKKNLKQRDGP